VPRHLDPYSEIEDLSMTEHGLSTVTDPEVCPLLADLGTAAEELGRLHWTRRQIITLADDSATLSNKELRDRLALPGHPQDRDQICPECRAAGATR
jgi:hypothetical protein